LIEELSELMNIDVRDSENGLLISTDGQILVSGSDVRKLDTVVYERDDIHNTNCGWRAAMRSNRIRENEQFARYLQRQHSGIHELSKHFSGFIGPESQRGHVTGYNLSGITGINFFSTGITGAAILQSTVRSWKMLP
jgi:hypothetical protein